MKIVMWVHHVPSYREAVLARIADTPCIDLVLPERFEDVPAALAGADGYISAGASAYTPEIERAIRDTPTLRWFQSVSAGNDNLEALGIRDGIAVTGSEGHSGPVVAEHAIALLLSIAHAIPDWERARIAKVWKMSRTGTYKSLYCGTAIVIGHGHIGSEIAHRLKGLGMVTLRLTRSSMLETLSTDYVKFLRSRGVPRQQIIWKHALRNAAIPVVAMLGIQLGYMLAGTVIIETVFNWPGVGRLMVEALSARDFPVIQAGVLFVSVVTVLLNLAVDLLFGIIDPRIRYD